MWKYGILFIAISLVVPASLRSIKKRHAGHDATYEAHEHEQGYTGVGLQDGEVYAAGVTPPPYRPPAYNSPVPYEDSIAHTSDPISFVQEPPVDNRDDPIYASAGYTPRHVGYTTARVPTKPTVYPTQPYPTRPPAYTLSTTHTKSSNYVTRPTRPETPSTGYTSVEYATTPTRTPPVYTQRPTEYSTNIGYIDTLMYASRHPVFTQDDPIYRSPTDTPTYTTTTSTPFTTMYTTGPYPTRRPRPTPTRHMPTRPPVYTPRHTPIYTSPGYTTIYTQTSMPTRPPAYTPRPTPTRPPVYAQSPTPTRPPIYASAGYTSRHVGYTTTRVPTQPTVYPTQPTVYPTQPTVYPTQPTVYPTRPTRPTIMPPMYTATPTYIPNPTPVVPRYSTLPPAPDDYERLHPTRPVTASPAYPPSWTQAPAVPQPTLNKMDYYKHGYPEPEPEYSPSHGYMQQGFNGKIDADWWWKQQQQNHNNEFYWQNHIKAYNRYGYGYGIEQNPWIQAQLWRQQPWAHQPWGQPYWSGYSRSFKNNYLHGSRAYAKRNKNYGGEDEEYDYGSEED